MTAAAKSKPQASKLKAKPTPFELPPVEVVSIDAVQPYWRNPRKNEHAVAGVKESILRYGVNQPLVVDAEGVIIVGHTRYRALIELGAKEISVVRPKLTKAKAKEYRIADNKTGEAAEWDRDPLIAELRALGEAGREMAPFFQERDLSALLADSAGTGALHRPVTADQMDKVLDRHNTNAADMTKARVDSQIELECPHCGEPFFVDRATIETHPGDRT